MYYDFGNENFAPCKVVPLAGRRWQKTVEGRSVVTEIEAAKDAGKIRKAKPAGGVDADQIKARFGYLLRRAHQTMRQNLEDELAGRFNITATQHAILTVVDSCGPIDQSAIARILDLDRMTVGVTLKNLVKADLVSQVQSPNDKRRNLIVLTSRAARQMPEIQRLATKAHESHVSARLSSKEQAQLATLLAKLTATLDS